MMRMTRRLVLAAPIGVATMNVARACSPPEGQQPLSPQDRADFLEQVAERLLHAPEPHYALVLYGRVLSDPVGDRSEIAVQRWFRGGLGVGETRFRATILVTSCGRFPTVGDEAIFYGRNDFRTLDIFGDGDLSGSRDLYQVLQARSAASRD